MARIITAKVIWIPSQCGGRQHDPFVGYRPTIRFQRHIQSWLKGAFDVEVVRLGSKNNERVVEVELKPNHLEAVSQVESEELFELLEGYRVVAVGKVVSIVGN